MSSSTDVLHQDPHGHDAHGQGAHDPNHQHHFATMEQQFDTSKLGMWIFLVTEVLTFGGLFAGFGLMQNKYPQEFLEAHEHLIRWQGTLNTIVLLVSSFTMVKAVAAVRLNERSKAVRYLALTIICAFIFLGVKYFEYTHKFEEGLFPGKWYQSQPTDTVKVVDLITNKYIPSPGYKTFFSFYFMMTGLHGIHILVGIALLTWVLIKTKNGAYGSNYYTPVDLVGLFWHLVDLVWIYLFPLYYLIS
jgi:cytochrome c oxidase subunit III